MDSSFLLFLALTLATSSASASASAITCSPHHTTSLTGAEKVLITYFWTFPMRPSAHKAREIKISPENGSKQQERKCLVLIILLWARFAQAFLQQHSYQEPAGQDANEGKLCANDEVNQRQANMSRCPSLNPIQLDQLSSLRWVPASRRSIMEISIGSTPDRKLKRCKPSAYESASGSFLLEINCLRPPQSVRFTFQLSIHSHLLDLPHLLHLSSDSRRMHLVQSALLDGSLSLLSVYIIHSACQKAMQDTSWVPFEERQFDPRAWKLSCQQTRRAWPNIRAHGTFCDNKTRPAASQESSCRTWKQLESGNSYIELQRWKVSWSSQTR